LTKPRSTADPSEPDDEDIIFLGAISTTEAPLSALITDPLESLLLIEEQHKDKIISKIIELVKTEDIDKLKKKTSPIGIATEQKN
jgi:hypothetical protein